MQPRHALIVPFMLPGDAPSFEVPSYGSRVFGPVFCSSRIGGFMVEIARRRADDLLPLAGDVLNMVGEGRHVEDVARVLCLLGRPLDLAGRPIDQGSYLARRIEMHEREADAAGEQPSMRRLACEIVAELGQLPWLQLSYADERAVDALSRRLQRLRARP